MPEGCSGLWRSEDMVLLQLHMQREVVHDTILKLGHLGCVQFREMITNVTAFQRAFTNDIRRCDDSERRIRYFEEQLKRENARRSRMQLHQESEGASTVETLDTLEPKLEGLETELRELNTTWEQLATQRNGLKEQLEVLSQDSSFFRDDEEAGPDQPIPDDLQSDLVVSNFRGGQLRYLAGLVLTSQLPVFERLVYRATRGNMFLRTNDAKEPVEDPVTGESLLKTVFIVFISSQRAYEKTTKLCESLQVNLYNINIDHPVDREAIDKISDHMRVLETTIKGTEDVRSDILQKIQQNIYQWKKTVAVEKSIFAVMNMISFKGQTAVAECWAPKADLSNVRTALSEAEESSGAQVESFMEQVQHSEHPPTYFKTNKFTSTHQGIVDSYGVARYKEVNPTCFSVITFPFLFGVMYGDIGHGALLTVIALVFLLKEKQMLAADLNEIIALIFGGRYVLLFMGIFAIYLGFLYNDFFAMMITPWGRPYWYFPSTFDEARENCDHGYVIWHGDNASLTRGCKKMGGTPYAFGVDSDWAEADNKLEFMNGLKMKMAVILGVIQMLWGLMLQLLNHLYFKDLKHVFFGWIPEVVFLSCTFGYMDIMIIIKWCVDWTKRSTHAPSLLETMTNFFLSPGGVQSDKYLYGSAGAQNTIQTILLLVAVICVPLMLIPIPIIEYRHHKKKHGADAVIHGDTEMLAASGNPSASEEHVEPVAAPEGNFDMSEVVIKQVIHTIEYVLGCVSNTASYLRLWALSLAHAELSEVFWNFAWMTPLEMDKGIGIIVFIGWGIWAGVTVGVLLIMESLSAFLHALRLHWVEFQNKFLLRRWRSVCTLRHQ